MKELKTENTQSSENNNAWSPITKIKQSHTNPQENDFQYFYELCKIHTFYNKPSS